MKVTKHASRPIGKTVKVSSIEGKKVLTKDGEKIGNLKNIHIDSTGLTIEGIRVSGGIFGEDSYIGRGYIHSMTEEGVILSIIPVERYVGLAVLDSRGRKVGKVKEVKKSRKTNTLVSIVVGRGVFGGEDLIFPKNKIKEIGKNIILGAPVKK